MMAFCNVWIEVWLGASARDEVRVLCDFPGLLIVFCHMRSSAAAFALGTRRRSELLMPPNAPATQQEECRRRDEQHLADCRQRPRKVAGTPMWPRNQPTTGKQRGGDSRT